MTRKKPKLFDKLKRSCQAIDNSLVDRRIPDVEKIIDLEEKMDNTFGTTYKNINFGKFTSNNNLKPNLKNSKRF